jgi:hypothetical protein
MIIFAFGVPEPQFFTMNTHFVPNHCVPHCLLPSFVSICHMALLATWHPKQEITTLLALAASNQLCARACTRAHTHGTVWIASKQARIHWHQIFWKPCVTLRSCLSFSRVSHHTVHPWVDGSAKGGQAGYGVFLPFGEYATVSQLGRGHRPTKMSAVPGSFANGARSQGHPLSGFVPIKWWH